MRLNTQSSPERVVTHEGGRARRITPEQELRRTVMACLLWEKTFYEDGVNVADRIKALVPKVPMQMVATLAVEARSKMNLRHVPLLLCREMARNGMLKAHTLASVIQRPDELTEFLAIYWKDGRTPLSAQVKKGLAGAFGGFSEYQLAKYNRPGNVKLRDVLFLCHAKPKDKEQDALWIPDTWEVSLSSGADKRGSFERLLKEKKIGALALLRNLRNMERAGVDSDLIRKSLQDGNFSRVLPFRFIAAAKYAPHYEREIEVALLRRMGGESVFSGKTVILLDVSGSMTGSLSQKSDMTRMDAACGLGVIARELASNVRIFTFSQHLVEIPPRTGFALRDAIISSQRHWSTNLGGALQVINKRIPYNRIIVVSDEQAHDDVVAPLPESRAYMLNVGTYKNGVGYGRRWIHIDGFSEACLKYIQEYEASAETPT
ncbi:MAG: TROVE domain-containing protein [Thermodesulfobacteriota bacterium]